jgi:hypothetical protein
MYNLNIGGIALTTKAYTEIVERLVRYRENPRIQEELNRTLHNSGDADTNYEDWLEGCTTFMNDNYDVLKEWL